MQLVFQGRNLHFSGQLARLLQLLIFVAILLNQAAWLLAVAVEFNILRTVEFLFPTQTLPSDAGRRRERLRVRMICFEIFEDGIPRFEVKSPDQMRLHRLDGLPKEVTHDLRAIDCSQFEVSICALVVPFNTGKTRAAD